MTPFLYAADFFKLTQRSGGLKTGFRWELTWGGTDTVAAVTDKGWEQWAPAASLTFLGHHLTANEENKILYWYCHRDNNNQRVLFDH